MLQADFELERIELSSVNFTLKPSTGVNVQECQSTSVELLDVDVYERAYEQIYITSRATRTKVISLGITDTPYLLSPNMLSFISTHSPCTPS